MEEDARRVISAPRFLRVRASAGKVGLSLRGSYLKDGLLWLNLRARNRSLIDFKPDLLRCYIEDGRRVRRTAVQSIDVKPVYTPVMSVLTGGGERKWALGFAPFVIGRGKRLVIEWNGGKDERRVRLVIRGKHILRTRNP
jgi:hypothetical protein